MSRTRRLTLKTDHAGVLENELVTFVNPGEWFKKRWIIGVGAGFSCLFYIVEAGCESDAIDELVDSKWGDIVKTECEHFDTDGCIGDECDYAGSYGEHVDLNDIRILERIGT